ncbi:hypothetical protein ES705_36529 [subsurface metagenome]
MIIARDKEFYERMNRVNEHLAKIELSQNDNKYCWLLFRKTFGYGKYEDKISRSQIADSTEILEVNVSRAERRLKKRNIIHANSKLKGFNLNTDQWQKVSLSIPFKKVSLSIQKGIAGVEKKGIAVDTYKETTKKLPKEGGEKKLEPTDKDIEKLEGKEWIRASMIKRYPHRKELIISLVNEFPFMALYDAWEEMLVASGVRDPMKWVAAKLRM